MTFVTRLLFRINDPLTCSDFSCINALISSHHIFISMFSLLEIIFIFPWTYKPLYILIMITTCYDCMCLHWNANHNVCFIIIPDIWKSINSKINSELLECKNQRQKATGKKIATAFKIGLLPMINYTIWAIDL